MLDLVLVGCTCLDRPGCSQLNWVIIRCTWLREEMYLGQCVCFIDVFCREHAWLQLVAAMLQLSVLELCLFSTKFSGAPPLPLRNLSNLVYNQIS